LCQLSIIQGWLNRLDQARSTGNSALHIAQKAGDSQVLALAHFNLGHLDVITGNLSPARRHLEQAVQLARSANAYNVLARSLQNQAYLATFTSSYAEAEQFAQAAVEAAKTWVMPRWNWVTTLKRAAPCMPVWTTPKSQAKATTWPSC
ncbi:MAG: hypothetical protein DCC55_38945, partial [Chloroflexi bacterium]